MRRWMYLGISAICCLCLWFGHVLWVGLSGQAVFRLTVETISSHDLRQIAPGMELSGFYMRESETFPLYETVAYHPDALGIVLTIGAPITNAQIESGEMVAMLSEGAAAQISPDQNCVGASVEIDGDLYRVVGIYRQYAPLLLITQTVEASAIIPASPHSGPGRFYAWFRAKSGMPFAFQTLRRALESMNATHDLGAFQGYNLDQISRMNRQGIRIWALLILSILCFRGLRGLKASRRAFLLRAKDAFSRHYLLPACARLIIPFLKHILPSLLLLAPFGIYLLHCARQLIINSERVPVKLLDPGAWMAKQRAFQQAMNRAESLPMYPYLLSAHLQTLCFAFGIIAAWCLLRGTKNR